MTNDMLNISILTDNPNSWIVPYAENLKAELSKHHLVKLCFKSSDIAKGDILFILGYTSVIPSHILQRNEHNFVVHESDLPKGRGWSPVSWQILERENKIPIIIFEATEEVDAGPIYFKDYIELNGTELLTDIKQKQGEKTVELILKLLNEWPNLQKTQQTGAPSYYPKRTRDYDKLDITKSLIENFNHLRIVDNERYPAWFEFKGQKYILKIYKAE